MAQMTGNIERVLLIIYVSTMQFSGRFVSCSIPIHCKIQHVHNDGNTFQIVFLYDVKITVKFLKELRKTCSRIELVRLWAKYFFRKIMTIVLF